MGVDYFKSKSEFLQELWEDYDVREEIYERLSKEDFLENVEKSFEADIEKQFESKVYDHSLGPRIGRELFGILKGKPPKRLIYWADDLVLYSNKEFPFSKEEYAEIIERKYKECKKLAGLIQFSEQLERSQQLGIGQYQKYVFKTLIITLIGGSKIRQQLDFSTDDDAELFYALEVHKNPSYSYRGRPEIDWNNAYQLHTNTSIHLLGRTVICNKFLKEFEYRHESRHDLFKRIS